MEIAAWSVLMARIMSVVTTKSCREFEISQ